MKGLVAVCALVMSLSCGKKTVAVDGGSFFREGCSYHIEYPNEILVTTAGKNDDFASSDGQLKGRLNCVEDAKATPESQLAARLQAQPSGFKLAFKNVNDGWYAFSGTHEQTIVYEKTVFGGKTVATLSMEYPLSAKARFDAAVTSLSNSFEEYEFFTGTVASDTSDSNWLMFEETDDPDAQNVIPTICRYNKSQAPRFAEVMLGQKIRVTGSSHFVTYRKESESLGALYRKELSNCVLKDVLTPAK